MKDTTRKLDRIYEEIDSCRRCTLAECAEVDNRPPRMRYKCGKQPVLLVAQNPGKRKEGTHVWGGLDLLFRVPGIIELAGEAWITNVVKCCTPNNKKPTKDQIRACQHWLRKEINAIQPRKIIALGKTAETALGRSINGIPIESCYHPRYIQFKSKKEACAYSEKLRRAIFK